MLSISVVFLFFVGACLLLGSRNPTIRALGLTFMFVAGKETRVSRRRLPSNWS